MAGTCVQTNFKKIENFQHDITGYVLTLLCTHHTDATLSVALASGIMRKLGGLYILAIKSYPGSVAPTDATDLSATDSDGLDLLGANGTNFIDATSTLQTRGYNTLLSTDEKILAVDDEIWTIATANNAVNSATFYLKIYLVDQI